ncbi:hypothetical protein LXL04_016993 [Taraxacum kok-saghyz]
MAEAVAAGAGVAATVIQAKAILLQPLKQTIASSNDMDEIYGELDRVMETLIARRNDLEDMAHNRKTTMMSSNTYTDWNTRVDVVAKEVDELKVRYTKENKRSPWFSINACCNFTKKMNNHIKVAEMFDVVIWVYVSRKGSMKHRDINQIQQDIIERLELNIGITSNVDIIANRIRAELTNIKYLLLLDDVNEDLDLDKIGVPMRENGSKIVITTRLQRVYSSIATTQINVEILKPTEAVELFKSELNFPFLRRTPTLKTNA